MLGRLFRRKTAADDHAPAAAGTPPAKPFLGDRIKAFFVAVWIWAILLAAIAGAVICARLAVGFWSSAEDLPSGGEAFFFRLMAGTSAAAAVFLGWQVGQGVRYLWHRRQEREARRDNTSLGRD